MQISGAYKDIAANLQRQIDACVKIADKATDDDVNNGIANKWVDAAHANAIGDIKLTTRSSLGENWLECNGDIIDKTEYPDLASIIALPTIGGSFRKIGTLTNAMHACVTHIGTIFYLSQYNEAGVSSNTIYYCYLWKNGSAVQLDGTIPKTDEIFADIAKIKSARIKHIISANGDHYYARSGTDRCIYLYNANGEVITKIALDTSALTSYYQKILTINDFYIDRNGSIVACLTTSKTSSSSSTYVRLFYAKNAISFTTATQTVALNGPHSGSTNISGLMSLAIVNNYVLYSEHRYQNSKHSTYLTYFNINSPNDDHSTTWSNASSYYGGPVFFSLHDDTKIIVKDDVDSVTRIYQFGETPYTEIASASISSCFCWVDNDYAYFMTKTGIYKASKNDLTGSIVKSPTITNINANNMPFSVLAQQSIAQFVSGDSIYLSGQPILPTIQDDLYKAFIRAK